MRILGSLVVASLTTVTAPAVRADAPAKPAPQVEAIRTLIGSWSGKGSMTSEGKTLSLTMTYDCVESSGAAGVRCRAVINGIPGFTYQFDDLWGYSAQDGLTHWYVVTNAGEVHDHRGHFDMNGGLLEIQVATEGKLFHEVIAFKRRGKNLSFNWQSTVGGTLREKGEMMLSPKSK
jgi:hypothetical protein